MTIKQVTITRDELNAAVGEWLSKRGITIPVVLVQNYSYSKEYNVEFANIVELKEPALTPVPTELDTITPVKTV